MNTFLDGALVTLCVVAVVLAWERRNRVSLSQSLRDWSPFFSLVILQYVHRWFPEGSVMASVTVLVFWCVLAYQVTRFWKDTRQLDG